jgi:hypothetical protein
MNVRKSVIRKGRAMHPLALRLLTRQLSMLMMSANTQSVIREFTVRLLELILNGEAVSAALLGIDRF